jgi:hypothetical protein
MPRILVTGLPNDMQGSEPLRDLLVTAIPLAVEGAEGFGISRDHVFVHALPDLVDERRVVTFTIEGLLAKPERTPQMRRALCEAVANALAVFLDRMHVPYESIVGWCVQTNRDEDGFVRRAGQLPSV